MSAVNQRHNLVLVFTDLSGSTRIAANAEPELYAELIAELRGLTATIVERHGGEVVRIDGDGALCIFGYPIAHEDAGRRAVEAALDLHAAVATLETGLAQADGAIAMHTGIHAGVVLLRSGDLVSGRYEMLGDATNVAARLCDAAGPGEVLVSIETLGPDRHLFEAGAERGVELAGKRQPLLALPITGRSAAATRFAARTRDVLTPFTGRLVERAAFAQWLAAPRTSAPALLVHGPAGIGKSRLLGELADDAALAGWRTVRGYCEAYLGARPLQPFRQVARQLGLVSEDGAAAFEAAILRAAAATPLLVELDDWQWADDASRDLLASLAAAAAAAGPSVRLRLLLASREDPGAQTEQTVGQVLSLPPLSSAECRDTISVLLRSFDTFALKRIEQASGGSPLLIEELCHAFAGDRPAPDSDPRGPWFDLAVQARFAQLDPGDQELLRLAAAIGHIVPTGLLAAVRGEAIGGEALARLEQADFLFAGDSPDTLRFKHGLTRDAVYAGIGMKKRQRLHMQVLDVLRAQAEELGEAGRLEALAWHSGAAGLHDEALPYAIRAGDAALADGALDRAQAHYRAGFEYAEKLPEGDEKRRLMWSLLNKFGLASVTDPAEDCLPVIERSGQVLEAIGDVAGSIRSVYWLGLIEYGLGHGKSSVAHLRTALTRAEADGNEKYLKQIQTKLAQSLFASGHYADAARIFGKVLPKISTLTDANDRDAAAYAINCFGFLLADCGDFTEAERQFQLTQHILPEENRPTAMSYFMQRAVVGTWKGEWEAVRELASRKIPGCEKSRARYHVTFYRIVTAYSEWKLTGDSWAIEQFDGLVRWFTVPGNSRQRSSLMFGWGADMMASIGERKRARAYAIELVDRVRVGGDRLGEGMTWRALARLEFGAGNLDRADHYLALAGRSAALRGSRREIAQNRLALAERHLAAGDPALARSEAEIAASEFAAMGMAYFAQKAARLTSR